MGIYDFINVCLLNGVEGNEIKDQIKKKKERRGD